MSKHISVDKIKKVIIDFFKKYKNAFKSTLILACFIFLTGFTEEYPELLPLLQLLKFFINLIRFCSAGIGGLIATIAGWNIIINTNGQGVKLAKSTLVRTLIGLTIVFFGSTIACFLVDQLSHLLLN